VNGYLFQNAAIMRKLCKQEITTKKIPAQIKISPEQEGFPQISLNSPKTRQKFRVQVEFGSRKYLIFRIFGCIIAGITKPIFSIFLHVKA